MLDSVPDIESVVNTLADEIARMTLLKLKDVVTPVVHASWQVAGRFDDFVKCSNCGWNAPHSTIYDFGIHYCPGCGAKMDEEEQG